jgi:lipopolysaccharide transport system ATP-binding protein
MGAITVSHLGKAYKQYPTRWARLAEWLSPFHRPRHHLHWVLQDIDFIVNPGEAVGIIGINGAGKSTLLKMITGTTQPTTGSVHITGRVAALLELGMGFHPDFTGRQNTFMAGQLLGYGVEEIAKLMPEIEAFAEIGEYIDQPVRVYSSGMQMRLAFSVATAHRPDVLIVDEALSVGDAYFQHKSFARIRKFRELGTTLLLVSHDKSAIQAMCDRAMLLEAGNLAFEGKPEDVFDYYNALLVNTEESSEIRQIKGRSNDICIESGTGKARVMSIEMLDSTGGRTEAVYVGQVLMLRITVRACEYCERLILGIGIKDRLGQLMYGTNTDLSGQPIYRLASGSVVCFEVVFPVLLGIGTYSIHTALSSSGTSFVDNYDWREKVSLFRVLSLGKPSFVGSISLDASIKSYLLEDSDL